MALTHLPLDQIDESRLHELIATAAAESLYIEYKRQTYGARDTDHAEFLADVSSFANSVGGDLVIGMSAEAGVPTGVVPFIGDPDSERQRLESMALSGIEPRITGLQTKAIALSQKGFVLLVRVPRSFGRPHRIIYQNKNRFYARSSARRYEPNVDELRSLFNAAPQLAEQIREFRVKRISSIVSHDTPVRLAGKNAFVLHVVPYSAFELGTSINMQSARDNAMSFPPPARRHPNNWRMNFDGLLTLSNVKDDAPHQDAYVQLYRSGIVEAVLSPATGGQEDTIVIAALEEVAATCTLSYLRSLRALGVNPPAAILVSLVGMRGLYARLGGPNWYSDDPPTQVDRDQLHFSEIIYESVPDDLQSTATVLRPLMDQLANAANHPASRSFDPNGVYQVR